jgi:hypothetical protein
LTGTRPSEVFREFQSHLGGLLNRTITDGPLSLRHRGENPYAQVTFRDEQELSTAVPIAGCPFFLAISQHLKVSEEAPKNWLLKTTQYSYHLLEGRDIGSRWIVRWEYVSPEVRAMEHPRHHVHLPIKIESLTGVLDLDALHLSTGWVTVEEIIRFLIVELGAKARSNDWPQQLAESEALFRKWTRRAI